MENTMQKHREIRGHKKKEISDSFGPCSYILNQPFFIQLQCMSQTSKYAKYIHVTFNGNMEAPDYCHIRHSRTKSIQFS
jgi:hypothetical protein